MRDEAGSTVARQLRFVVASWKEDARTDVELLRRFVATRDEAAFTTLVGRHSALVWGVCLRVLRNQADAEDALQATFLRLARDARRIINKESPAGWLYRVARDCAVDLQRSILRQRRIEERVAAVARGTGDAAASSDLRVLLDDELDQLPRSERAVLVMCCLEGRTYADAALELGCSTAAVHRRMLRAQARLRKRFLKRGGAAGAVLAAFLGGNALPAASAAPPLALARSVEAGLAAARTGALPASRAGVLAGAAAAPAWGQTQLLLLSAIAAALLLGGLCAVLRTPSDQLAQPAEPPSVAQERPAEPPATALGGVVRGPDGRPVPGAAVAVLARRPFGPAERGLRDEVLATATADAEGRFRVPVPDRFETWFADRLVTVHAHGPGLAPATAPVRLGAGGGPVELNLGAATPLRGRLVDGNGRPAAGVRVEVIRAGDAVAEPVVGAARGPRPDWWPAPAETDADGRFAFPALGGCPNVWVRVEHPRFALDAFPLDGRRDLTLAPARPLAVEVRAADTGAPMGGARVTVVTERVGAHPHFAVPAFGAVGPRHLPFDTDAVTDAQGRVRVNLAPGDRAEVLVHPPADAGPYVGVRAFVSAGEGASEYRLAVQVPRGRWLTGTVTDSSGRPLPGAAVHWGREDASRPEWNDEFLVGRDALARAGAGGAFKLAVLPGPCSVRVYGPTADYEPHAAKLPGQPNTNIYAHHIQTVAVPASGSVPPVRAELKPAEPLRGTVAGPPGAAFVLASGRVSPVRGYAAVPIPVRDGRFQVPGSRPGFTTRAYVLDPVAKVGGAVDLTPGAAPGAELKPCGTIAVRVLGPGGVPVAGRDILISLLVERDRPSLSAADPGIDGHPVEWFDAVNYAARPKTGPDGRAVLVGLIPGAKYRVTVGAGPNRVPVGVFAIEPGVTLSLPDVLVDVAAPEGAAP